MTAGVFGVPPPAKPGPGDLGRTSGGQKSVDFTAGMHLNCAWSPLRTIPVLDVPP